LKWDLRNGRTNGKAKNGKIETEEGEARERDEREI
jgi:hypothetical protein